jgi:hypothetical protein
MSKTSNKLKALNAVLKTVLEAYIELRDKEKDPAPFNRVLATDDPFADLANKCVKAFTDAGHPVTIPLLASLCRTAYTDSKRKDKHAFPLERYNAETLIDLSVWFASNR